MGVQGKVMGPLGGRVGRIGRVVVEEIKVEIRRI